MNGIPEQRLRPAGLNPGVECATPQIVVSNERERETRKSVRNVADTGEGDGRCCCQEDRRVKLGLPVQQLP